MTEKIRNRVVSQHINIGCKIVRKAAYPKCDFLVYAFCQFTLSCTFSMTTSYLFYFSLSWQYSRDYDSAYGSITSVQNHVHNDLV